jgi:protein-L-isoaspartate(D-aspartate) O-methyltransferase
MSETADSTMGVQTVSYGLLEVTASVTAARLRLRWEIGTAIRISWCSRSQNAYVVAHRSVANHEPMTERSHERRQMVEQLVVQHQLHRGPIVSAIQHAWRHVFVPNDEAERAYIDQPILFDEERVVSAPSDVATMTELLDVEPGERVLEIGTGSGYHTAVTADIVGSENVYTVESDEKVAAFAESNLETLDEAVLLSTVDFSGIDIRVGDESDGWAEHAPYDAIYLTRGIETVPEALFEQLDQDGRLLAPIGETERTLVLFEPAGDGELVRSEYDSIKCGPLCPQTTND